MRPQAEDDFRAFVAARSPSLLRTAYLLSGGDWATAEDLLQGALTNTFLAWGRINDPGAVEAYVRRTLANTATSWWRRRWHRERSTATLPEAAGGDAMRDVDERDALWRLVRELPPRQRACLVLRYYENWSEAETAAALNLSVGTVKSHTARALKALRAELISTGGTPWNG